MSAATRYPVKAASEIDAEKEERLALRALREKMVEIIDGTDATISAIQGATVVSTLRAQTANLARQQRELARALRSLCRVVGGADRA